MSYSEREKGEGYGLVDRAMAQMTIDRQNSWRRHFLYEDNWDLAVVEDDRERILPEFTD